MFLGCLTFAANDFKLPNGQSVRDSEALPYRLRVKRTGGKRVCKASVARSSRDDASRASAGRAGASRRVRRGGSFAKCSVLASFRAAELARTARTMVAFQAGVEASFLESWCEERAASLKPSSGPSASERMNALKLRVLSKGCGSSGCK